MSDGDKAEIEALNKEVTKLMIRLGRAVRNNTGTRFTAKEVQILRLTEYGNAAEWAVQESEEGVEGE